MIIDEKLFLERYEKLNDRQKEAVDHIYGPVMVIAGPGTGKTEVLSMRIANLLRSEAQVQPHEILCVTYTEEATNSMRRRLVQVIGPAAHKVNIHTFHAFCNNVIQNNSELFSFRALQPITDLERTEMLYKLLEELPSGHPLRKLSGNIYFDVGKLSRLFDLMKREYLSPDYISDSIDVYVKSLPEREEYVYKRAGKGYQKGDLKQDKIDEEIRKMEGTRAAALLFPEYEKMMKDAGRYDFNDMILWVLEAFKQNAALLQSYQERYQFILVDEFQDTNGAQNELISLLTSYWEDPNIFVVGDDDQGVYEFQGARIRNIIDFYVRHKESIKIVILPHNYRSSQPILDKAMTSIQYNKHRLINQLQELELDKNIVAAAERFKEGKEDIKPVIKAYGNIVQEEADIVLQIEQLQRSGIALNHIAIIYAQHKQADNIISIMQRRGIPYNVRKPVNILQLPLIEQVLNVLTYLDTERKKKFDSEELLFELMHAPYFGISSTDIAQLALYMQTSKKEKGPTRWRLLLNNVLLLESLNLKSAKAMARLGNRLDEWEQQQLSLPLPLLLEKIIHESGVVAHLVRTTDHVWNIQVLYTFFEFVKDAYNRNLKIKPGELLQMVQRMNDEKIELPIQRIVQNENGLYFYTAHSAKGNEFEHVFLIGCTKNFWEDKKGGTNEYRMPDTITATEDDTQKTNKTEVARRLFYVAMTRAKKHLHISFATADNAGKPLETSSFVDEICPPEERNAETVPSAELVKFMEQVIEPVPEVRIKTANAQWIDRELQQIAISPTSLSKFLQCPLTFYYENILKVPFQKNDALAFGSAIHTALERMFLDMKQKKGEFADKETVLGIFRSALFSEAACFTPVQFDRRMEQGTTLLSDYYDHYISNFHKDVEIEYKVPRYLLDGVPITGKIDKLELNGDSCKVIDYKTGDPDKYASVMVAAPNEKTPLGGDYWRQMVFYKILLENAEDKRMRVTTGMFDFIQKGKNGEYKQVLIPMFAQDEEFVRAQIKDVHSRIMNHEFDRGCGEESCHWCNFARRYELIRPTKDEVVEIDDI
ncbi:MAG: ATP-dependent helicase [Flavipsychrobacter sp.]|jgi:DNA helicase-2/ATP-dependent DNA helicase PcrA|nr:ATP-dependent helicase [Flavipsychrobacter sp.]